MYGRRRKPQLSQNFLRSRTLVQKLVRRSSIGKNDLVLEIGPGEGIITQELLQVARRVVAVELDGELFRCLKKRFGDNKKLTLFHGDALGHKLPLTPYKVFANIPFSIEGKMVRRLINSEHPSDDCYLVMRREVALRLGGINRASRFSISHQPWFSFEIAHRFLPCDFIPAPKVRAVMLRITRRIEPQLSVRDKERYQAFIRQGFGGGRRLRQNLKPFFDRDQLGQLGRRFGFSINDKPSDLRYGHWLVLFYYLRF